MTSLAEAYEENVGEVGNVRLLYLGVGLFAVGVSLVVFAILLSTTDVHSAFGLGTLGAREVAGVLAGLGVPAVFVGIFSVLPASQRVRAAAAIGAGVSLLGVALFTHAYPKHWAGYGRQLTLPVVAVYFFGALVTFGCLFVAVVNFKTRNDPGGTVTLEVSHEGEVRTVEVRKGELDEFDDLDDLRALRTGLADSAAGDPDNDPEPVSPGMGGVGFFGDTPDGETPTQTNQPERGAPGRGSATSDGGTAADDDIRSPLDDGEAPDRPHPTTDAYCGNCQHFQYVRTNEGMQPHCGFYGRTMSNMDACEEWEPNS
ncbi:YihY/virulence factor BrkB family protein [Halorussus aquaticus]|uniref:YihY/virulence factor BrkB family protein n=1 Tax=Halorussus aquaticus TaxID=2953748 RepID=A0ABD5Q0C8_9EURY|nr:YihY/virulence factor BrkB family protein [Halorussus aquaticus]